MEKKDFLEQFAKETDLMYNTSYKKNQDYTGDGDAFKNFLAIEELTDKKITAEEGILVRMTDKINRIANLLYKPNEVVDEKIQDTLLDLAVYSIILKIYLSNKK